MPTGTAGSTQNRDVTKSRSDAGEDMMTLFVWGSGWGLPSIDTNSLQIMAYIKFSGAPVSIIQCENPWKSPKGVIPFFQHGSKILYSPSEISAYLRQKNYSCDFGLTPKQCGEVIAYKQLVTEALDPALKFFCWVHDSNYESVISPCYSKRLPWRYKFWYPRQRMRKQALELVTSIYGQPLKDKDDDSPKSDIIKKAQDCINTLSDKLGTQEFFCYPNSPSALDAHIFGYLSPFLKIPLPDCPIKNMIRLTPNLERFVSRILHRYYSNLRGDLDSYLATLYYTEFLRKHRSGGDCISSTSDFGLDGHPFSKKDEVLYPPHQKVLAIAVGLCVMFAFAYTNGMIQIGFLPEKSSIDREDENEDNLIWE